MLQIPYSIDLVINQFSIQVTLLIQELTQSLLEGLSIQLMWILVLQSPLQHLVLSVPVLPLQQPLNQTRIMLLEPLKHSILFPSQSLWVVVVLSHTQLVEHLLSLFQELQQKFTQQKVHWLVVHGVWLLLEHFQMVILHLGISRSHYQLEQTHVQERLSQQHPMHLLITMLLEVLL